MYHTDQGLQNLFWVKSDTISSKKKKKGRKKGTGLVGEIVAAGREKVPVEKIKIIGEGVV